MISLSPFNQYEFQNFSVKTSWKLQVMVVIVLLIDTFSFSLTWVKT